MIVLGSTTLQLGLIFGVLALAMSLWYLNSKDIRFYIAGKRSLLASAFLVQASAAALTYALVISDFRLEYVARYSSADTPLIYRIGGLWAGMEGSLLFWTAILGIYIMVMAYTNRNRNQTLMPVITVVLSIIMIFFLAVVVSFENPFTQLPAAVALTARGNGLNPLLQHWAMLIHPPALYLGYVGFAIPFAFAVAALVNRRLDATWIRSTRRWTLIPWLFLSIGVILGGRWAYVELGWGGYWAWDPVENASILPWLTGTAYLHSVIIQEKKNMLKMWNVILIMLTFTLTIFGTYLTRSGIISSVHAFAASDMSLWFFLFVIFIIVACVILLIVRKDELSTQRRLESFTSRESGFLFNNMILLGIAAAVLWGTMFPVLSEAVRGTQITVGAPYFDKITTPMGLLLLAMIGIGPLLAWRRTSVGTFKRNFFIPAIASIFTITLCMFIGVRSIYPLLNFGLVAFVLAGILAEVTRGIKARRRMGDESVLTALNTMVDKNRSRYGGYLVHIGIVVMFIGFGGKAFTSEKDSSLSPGKSVTLKGYTFTMMDFSLQQRVNHEAKIVTLDVTRNGRFITSMRPEKRFYRMPDTPPNTEVAIYTKLSEDLYAILGDVDMATGDAVIKIMINPLTSMVWAGGWILVLGTIVAIWPNRVERRMKKRKA